MVSMAGKPRRGIDFVVYVDCTVVEGQATDVEPRGIRRRQAAALARLDALETRYHALQQVSRRTLSQSLFGR